MLKGIHWHKQEAICSAICVIVIKDTQANVKPCTILWKLWKLEKTWQIACNLPKFYCQHFLPKFFTAIFYHVMVN